MNNEIKIGSFSFGVVTRAAGKMLRVSGPPRAKEVPASADELRELAAYLEDMADGT